MTDHDLDAMLRAAARPAPPARVHGHTAQDLLERIVATPRTGPEVTVARRRRGTGWWAVAGTATLAVTAIALLTPGIGSGQTAYASWSATPAPLAAGAAAAISRECARKLASTVATAEADVRTARKVIAERRGAYSYLSIITKRWAAACFRDRDGAVEYSGVIADPGGDDGHLGREGAEMQTWGQLRTVEGYVRIMSGHVGPDVTAVDVSPRPGETVHATLDGGYFLAWYPEKAGAGAGTTVTLRLAGGGVVGGLPAGRLYETPYVQR